MRYPQGMEIIILLAVLVLIQATSLAVQIQGLPSVPQTLDESIPGEPRPTLTGKPWGNETQLLIGRPGAWRHHSWRPAGHADIDEAIKTPGMAVVDPDGTLVEGEQGA